MATINLGRVKPVFRGAYAGGTAYVVDDIVTSGNETFICIQASTGNATSNASYWTKLAAKGTDGSDGTDVGTTITTQGDILYRDGSGLQRLGAGTSGQFLKTQGTGANPVWANASSATQGQWKYLSSHYITSDTSDWYMDNVLDHTNHDHYYLKVMNLNSTSASNNDLWLGLRTGGASGSHYAYDVYQARIRAHPSGGGQSAGHQTDDYARLQHSGMAGNSNVDTAHIEIYLYNLSNKKSDGTADFHRPFWQSFTTGYSAGSPYASIHYAGGFWDNSSVDITGFHFKDSGSSLRGATRPLIYLYGQVKH